jgi:hypothetical protein
MPFPIRLPPPGMKLEDLLVYGASEMPDDERARYVLVLEDEIGRSGLDSMVRAVERLKRAAGGSSLPPAPRVSRPICPAKPVRAC